MCISWGRNGGRQHYFDGKNMKSCFINSTDISRQNGGKSGRLTLLCCQSVFLMGVLTDLSLLSFREPNLAIKESKKITPVHISQEGLGDDIAAISKFTLSVKLSYRSKHIIHAPLRENSFKYHGVYVRGGMGEDCTNLMVKILNLAS